jgi:hypothetical protein
VKGDKNTIKRTHTHTHTPKHALTSKASHTHAHDDDKHGHEKPHTHAPRYTRKLHTRDGYTAYTQSGKTQVIAKIDTEQTQSRFSRYGAHSKRSGGRGRDTTTAQHDAKLVKE